MPAAPEEREQQEQAPHFPEFQAVEVEDLVIDRGRFGDDIAAAVKPAVADGDLQRERADVATAADDAGAKRAGAGEHAQGGHRVAELAEAALQVRRELRATSALRPMLATLKNSSPLTDPTSIDRVPPSAITRIASSRATGMPSVRARSLAVPVGRIPSGRLTFDHARGRGAERAVAAADDDHVDVLAVLGDERGELVSAPQSRHTGSMP